MKRMTDKEFDTGTASANRPVTARPTPTLQSLFPAATLRSAPSFTLKSVLVATDVLALLLAALGGSGFQSWYAQSTSNPFAIRFQHAAEPSLVIYSVLVLVALARFWTLGHYTRRRPFWDETRETLTALLILAVVDAALMYLGKLAFSRFWFLSTWILAFLFVPTCRVGIKSFLLYLGHWRLPTIIIGAGENAREAAEALHSERLMGLDVIAFGALHASELPEYGVIQLEKRAIPVALLQNPVTDIARIGQPSVVVALEGGELAGSQRLVEQLHRKFTDLSIVPALKGLPLYGMEINHFFRHEALFLRLRNNLGRRAPRLIKRGFDITVSVLLLIVLAPLFAYIAIRIKKSGGSVFFGHSRVGRQGKPFNCYKFHSMIPNAQGVLNELLANDAGARAEWQRDFKLKNDPRVTPIGAFLRKTSLDELPQLWNVLRGDMSLVGPRPVIDIELSRYGECVEYYLETRPGMTGLWQISGRNDTDYRNRVYLDTWYVKNWSLWQDIVILIKTIRVVFWQSGAY